jgi:hypothetical protein
MPSCEGYSPASEGEKTRVEISKLKQEIRELKDMLKLNGFGLSGGAHSDDRRLGTNSPRKTKLSESNNATKEREISEYQNRNGKIVGEV